MWSHCSHTTLQRTGSDLIWTEVWKFEVTESPSALQEGVLTVQLMQENKQVAGVSIPLWNIVVGPCAQSFPVLAKGKSIGRFEADVHVLQMAELHLQFLRIQAVLPSPCTGHLSFTLRFLSDHELLLQSEIQEEPTWLFVPNQMVFSLSISATSFILSALHFKLLQHSGKNDRVLIAESWLGLARLLKSEPASFPKNAFDIRPRPLPQSEHPFQTSLWIGGQQAGTLTGLLRMTGAPFLAQLPLGVHTEQGYKLQNTEFLPRIREQATWRPQIPSQLAQLDALTRELKDLIQRADPLSPASIQAHVSHSTMLSYELRNTEREGQAVHVYASLEEVQAAQLLLLDLGEFLLEYADSTVFEARGLYYECLVLLARRGELDLGHLGMENKDQQSIGQRYWRFLKLLLSKALSKLGEKGSEPRIREFAEFICAQCYFRVASFREELLSVLKSDEHVKEWRGTTYDLEQDMSQPWAVLDWHKYFGRFLPLEQQQPPEVLAGEQWKTRLAKRKVAYFRFLCEWTRVVIRAFDTKTVPWHELPGYHILVKSLLLEMKHQRSYSEALQQAALSFLANTRIISVYLLVQFHKTNVHQPEAVSQTLVLVGSWLTALHESGAVLPTTFPSAFFSQGLARALNSDLMLNQVSVLWLLYRCYHIFDSEIKQEVVLNLLLAQPAPYMYHWNHMVREAFWTLVLYRLLSLKTLSLFPLTAVDRSVLAKAEETMSKAQTLQGGVTEPFVTAPYESASRGELQRALRDYEAWLNSVNSSRRLGGFPFPDLHIPRPFEDTVEERLAEDW